MTAVYTIGVDVGGTFTDLCLADENGPILFAKTLTSPADPSAGVERGLEELLRDSRIDPGDVTRIVHGTTLVTNAIIERKGAVTALLATAGFRDAVEIGRERRYELYDLLVELPRPLAPRYLRFDVPERVYADGAVGTPLDRSYVERLGREFAASGVESVAVCYLHSFTNPAHERETRDVLARVAPDLPVAISSDVAPELGEYERASTTLANAYVLRIVQTYLAALQGRVQSLGVPGNILVMLSSGGLATIDTARSFPIRMLESGPAGGALAAAAYARGNGTPDLLSFDMGGTTAKLCVIERGVPRIGDDLEVGRVYRLKPGSGLPVRVPSVDMVEVGAGGGSIARVNSLGLVNVGPDSAGADPGPACYGQGGSQPTVTDADLVLGYLDPRYFLGGRMRLDRDAAFAVLEEHVASKLGVSVEEAAAGIHLLVNEGMANAARAHVLERGLDPHVLPLFAFGGAGPVHAVGVAASLGSPAVIVPYGAGVLSALGFLAAPVAFDLVRSCRIDLGTRRWSDVDELVHELEDEGGGLLAESGVPSADVSFTRIAEMRYIGQGQAVRVGLPEGELPDWQSRLLGDFEGAYRTLYGHGGPLSVPVEIVRVRVTASGPAPRIHIEPTERRMTTPASAGERDAYFSSCGGFVRTPVWERAALKPGAALPGPAVVQEPESTLVVPPDHEAVVTDELALRVSKTAV